MSSNSSEGFDPSRGLGLLPHERQFIESLLPDAREARQATQRAVGEANANSGGDWAFDDPATQAVADEAVLKDAALKNLEAILRDGNTHPPIDYPDPSDVFVRIGSRVTYETPRYKDTIDLVTRKIPRMPEDEANEVDIVSVTTALGSAVVGRTVGQGFTWAQGDNIFTATVIGVDQQAQREFYARVLGPEQ